MEVFKLSERLFKFLLFSAYVCQQNISVTVFDSVGSGCRIFRMESKNCQMRCKAKQRVPPCITVPCALFQRVGSVRDSFLCLSTSGLCTRVSLEICASVPECLFIITSRNRWVCTSPLPKLFSFM